LDHAQKQDSACPWKLPGSRTANTRKLGPSKLSGRRSGLDPSPRSEPAESGHSSSAGGLPPPQELAPGFERDQVSGRNSISAPFRFLRREPTPALGSVAFAVKARHQPDSGDEISPIPSAPTDPELGLHRVPLPAGSHHPGGPLVPAVRPFLPRPRGATGRARHRGRPCEHLPVVHRFALEFAEAARTRQHVIGDRWHVDETYLKVGGTWRYLFRAIDQFGQVIDVLLSPRRDATSARRFFDRAISRTRIAPVEVTTDRYRVYPRVLDELLQAALHATEVHANNALETDHGRLKARLRPMRGLKRDRTARVIVAGHASSRTSAGASTSSAPKHRRRVDLPRPSPSCPC
jgi:transposase, IS6 family